jgi:hypothetical protein
MPSWLRLGLDIVAVATVFPSRVERAGTSPMDGVEMRKRTVVVNDKMQKRYRYVLSAPVGRNFDPEFKPELTPRKMLRLGVFCGKYMTDARKEFPNSWFAGAKLAHDHRDCALNFFGVDASQPLSIWRNKGWIHPDDPRGWFQWYCRYHMGRRLSAEDAGRSRDGRPCAGMCARSNGTASQAICFAGRGSGGRCCTVTPAEWSRQHAMLALSI